MRIFGLTGGIGSGKSTVARLLRERGIPVVDADELARSVVEPGTPGLSSLVDAFGSAILLPSGALDRPRLGRIVFENPEARERLNAILHPRIAAAAESAFQQLKASGVPLAGYEIPLLFETAQEARYRPIVVVHVDRETQVERASRRMGVPRDEVIARVNSQLPLEEKVSRADFCVDNNGDEAALIPQIDVLVPQLEAWAR